MAVTEGDVAYNETFYGYSPHGYVHARELVRYIALIMGSKIVLWLSLMKSGEFGFEREVIEKATLDKMPIPDFRKFGFGDRNHIVSLFECLRLGKKTWEDADAWVAKLYGLGSRDLQIIYDTLEFNLPFAKNKKKAQSVPGDEDINHFCDVLEEELLPWAVHFNRPLSVFPIQSNDFSPWRGVIVSMGSKTDHNVANNQNRVLYAADYMAASEVFIRVNEDNMLVNRLAQRRYWSASQARLLAHNIVWSHSDFLKGRF